MIQYNLITHYNNSIESLMEFSEFFGKVVYTFELSRKLRGNNLFLVEGKGRGKGGEGYHSFLYHFP